MSGTTRPTAPDQARVARMFDSVAARYDLVNSLLSMGLDKRWRRAAARAIPTRARVLDLGCGSGKLGEMLAPRARVTGLDVSAEMLRTAQRAYGEQQSFVLGSAFALPFDDATFEGATSAFVLRNLSDLAGAFVELRRVVAPGGTIALVDITGPQTKALRVGFDAYFSSVAPLLGRMVGEPEAYRYLSKSLSQLPAPTELAGMLGEAGFERARAHPLTLGMVTLWTAHVPATPAGAVS